MLDREEAAKEADFPNDDATGDDEEEDEWDETQNWEEAEEPETDVAVEGQAYLTFLQDEVCPFEIYLSPAWPYLIDGELIISQ